VRIVRAETPEDKGTYGVATRRFTYMGYGGTKEYVQALRDIVVAIMIEKPGTVDTPRSPPRTRRSTSSTWT
jgi:hypothetical protein